MAQRPARGAKGSCKGFPRPAHQPAKSQRMEPRRLRGLAAPPGSPHLGPDIRGNRAISSFCGNAESSRIKPNHTRSHRTFCHAGCNQRQDAKEEQGLWSGICINLWMTSSPFASLASFAVKAESNPIKPNQADNFEPFSPAPVIPCMPFPAPTESNKQL
jgi:hypothetical protein